MIRLGRPKQRTVNYFNFFLYLLENLQRKTWRKEDYETKRKISMRENLALILIFLFNSIYGEHDDSLNLLKFNLYNQMSLSLVFHARYYTSDVFLTKR